MQEIIANAEAIILAEAKTELKAWEQAVVSSCKKVAEALNLAENPKPIEASEEEINELLKFI